MFFLASRGYRCIAHDRRGHGRSSQPWNGNDLDTYADDLAALVEKLEPDECDPRRPLHGRRRSRPLHRPPRHEARRQGRADRRHPAADAEDARAIPAACRSTCSISCAPACRPTARSSGRISRLPFYGYNRPGAKISEGVRESFWLQGMMAGFPASYFCIKAFSETDLTEDLKKIDVPTLVLHGDDDQIVPIARFCPAFLEDHQECDAEGLQGRPARHVHDPQGPGQRGAARVHQGIKKGRGIMILGMSISTFTGYTSS